MYKIENGTIENLKTYILSDVKSGTKVTIAPERGGIITSFEVDGREMLYMDYDTFNDRKRNVRGGNPILFPICGPLENKRYYYQGDEYQMENHGLVRNYPWHVEDTITQDGAGITISIKSCDEMKKKYPFDFEVIFRYILKGNKLTINQQYINKSDKPMPMYAGFHPYFNTSDRNTVEYGIDAKTLWDSKEECVFDYNGKIEFPNEDPSLYCCACECNGA